MIRSFLVFGVLVAVASACSPVMVGEDISKVMEGGTFNRAGDYKIGPGDLLAIKVFGEEALSGEYVVAPSGTIQYPLIGFLTVDGLSQVQVSRQLEHALGSYVKDPKIAVSVADSQSYQVYFSGEVQMRGPKGLKARTNLLQGIIMAGGPTVLASGKIYLIRHVGEHQIRRYVTTYADLLKGKNALDFLYLERGDVIHVE